MRKKYKKNATTLAFLCLSVLGTMIFYFVPFVIVIYYSFLNNPIEKKFVGVKNFSKIIKNHSFRMAFFNTIKIIGIGLPIVLIVAFILLKMLIDVLPSKVRFNTFFLLPLAVPVSTVVIVIQVIFADNGIINLVMGKFHLEGIEWLSTSAGFWVLLVIFLWKNIGLAVFFLFIAHSKIPQEYIHIAKLECASDFYIFWHIKLHFFASTIVFISIFSIINSFKLYREVVSIAGEHPINSLYLLQNYLNNVFTNLNYQSMAAASILICVMLFAVVSFIYILERIYNRDYE